MNNVKKSMKDFTIYFLTLTFGVCLFYVFNSISSQQAMLTLSATQYDILGVLQKVMGVVSVFISFILGFLIVYANRFLIKRRKKELGIYMVLGMEKSNISHILILETMIIGVFALAVGLLIGVFASQGLAVVTAKMFEVEMKEFTFIFSPSAAIKSIIYFGVIFMVVMIFNSISISKYKLIDLLTAAKKNETLKVKKLWVSVILFILSVISLGVAYYLIIDNGFVAFDIEFMVSISLGIIGTFLFFMSLSGFLLRVIQGNKNIYYKGLNMFVLRQINSKITTTFVSMTLICLMLLLSIGILSTGAGLAKTMSSDLKKNTPYDVSLEEYEFDSASDIDISNPNYIMDKLSDHGMKLDDIVSDYKTIQVYDLKVTMDKLLKYYFENNYHQKKEMGWTKETPLGFISLSQYNNNLILQGKEPITLKDKEFAISSNYSDAYKNHEKFIKNSDTLIINGKEFTAYPRILEDSYCSTVTAQNIGTIIINDSELKEGIISKHYLNMEFKGDKEQGSKIFRERFDSVYNEEEKPMFYYVAMVKTEIYASSVGLSTVISYIAIYIGVIFLITCSAVLALQQLSESADNLERYKLLRKIGVEEKEINKSIFTQIFIYFMMPLALAIIHSCIGISVANNIIKLIGNINAATGIMASAVGIVLVYGGYMIATYFGCKSMARSK